ncbi:hypothetical protein QBC34DRAFT_422698 [Podospora aff. communis PSN243]|uniref:Mid2 domain-containing protein n=1 Tax=Podospora aff. communis PSN243 TaxID=3040156 RepID=A0AAV9H060_9PEZI|nr:hypothetical protein QBC34DRAFT_422698 [Podospora aff. communis PSN243]
MSWPKVLAVAATCAVLPLRAGALGVRQAFPDREAPARTSGIQFPGSPGQPTVTVTTRLSVTVTTGTGTADTTQSSNSGESPPDITGPTPGVTSPGSDGGSGTTSETLLTDMPTFPGPLPTDIDFEGGSGSTSGSSDGIRGNRTLVIVLSSVLSVVGLLLILGAILLCRRKRRGRFPFFPRGASPIDDDEIATWKVPKNEKGPLPGAGGAAVSAATAGAIGAAGATVLMVGAAGRQSSTDGTRSSGPNSGASSPRRSNGGIVSHAKSASTTSIKKPPSVIVYSNARGVGGCRHSSENSSPRSHGSYDAGPVTGLSGKTSFDKVLPQTPIQAKAPNARAGLTDESIPGDEPFIATPRSKPSRLSKLPPGFSPSQRRTHVRTRSSRSSFRSFNEYAYSGSELELPARHSHDYIPRSQNSNWHVSSSSSVPPRLSFSNESFLGGNLSPRPLLGDHEIGRAIG